MLKFLEYLQQPNTNPTYRKLVKGLWIAVLAGLLIGLVLFIVLAFGDLPSVKQLENPKSEEATLIYSADGEILGRYYTENRVPIPFDSLSDYLVEALIATEDERFYKHSGIDFQALSRVAVKTVILQQRSAGGGSTITQQLAKLLFTDNPARSIRERALQKLREWIIAISLERRYTKEEIMAMYLNKFNFNYNSYGIEAASEIYFGKHQRELKLEEAAMLIGMLKNPSLYNPIRRPDTVMHRREVVLHQMEKNNLISDAEYDSLRQLPLGINYQRKSHIDGIATYFRAELAKDVRSILKREDNLKADGKPYDLYRDGLRIYTTIDGKMQRLAEQTMREHMSQVQETFFKVWKNRDPWTYTTDSELDIPVSVRMETLDRLIRESQRYQDMRGGYLDEALEKAALAFPDFRFHDDDRELVRLMRADRERGYLDTLVKYNILSTEQRSDYRQVMRSPVFDQLKASWERLQKRVKTKFNEPVKMTVFAYNDEMETDTVMSPLDSIKYHRMFLQTGILAVDPRSGRVKVWIGGINHKYFQYDHVRTNRQVGSTFKPFIYATAIEQQGISPCFEVYDIPHSIRAGEGRFNLKNDWTPSNAEEEFTGQKFTLKEGLRKSKNTVSVYLMKQLTTVKPVLTLINEMGIDINQKYPNGHYRITRGPSICLGSTDLTVMEMTGAYTTFANNGIYHKPQYIERIEDKNGKVLYTAVPVEGPALPENANYAMVELLRYAGTGFASYQSDVGGKTGTTNEFVDGWFMGITPDLVVGTWVGGEDRWIRFTNLLYGQGAYMAKPFFKSFLKKLEATPDMDYDPQKRFYRPPGDLGIELDCELYDQDDGDESPYDLEEDPFEEDVFGQGEPIQPDLTEDS